MCLDFLDEPPTSLRDQIRKRRNVIIIGLCVMISLFVVLGLLVKAKVESDNELRKKYENSNIQTNRKGESISESFSTNIFFQTMVDRAQKEK
jgi:hypothetical protein